MYGFTKINRTSAFVAASAAAALFLPAAGSQGVVVVDWNGANDYQANGTTGYDFARSPSSSVSSVDFDGDGFDDAYFGAGFDTTTPLNPAGPGYDTAKPSAVFYGGYGAARVDGTTALGGDTSYIVRNKVRDQSGSVTDDTIQLQIFKSTSDGTRQFAAAGVYVWELATPIDLTQAATFTYAVSALNPKDSSDDDYIGLVVRQDGQWYLYSTQLNQSGTTKTRGSLDDNFSKAVDFTANGGNVDVTTGFNSATTFDNVSAVGVYFENDAISAVLQNNSIYHTSWIVDVKQLTVDAVLVPEPGSLALLCLGGMLAFSRRKG